MWQSNDTKLIYYHFNKHSKHMVIIAYHFINETISKSLRQCTIQQIIQLRYFYKATQQNQINELKKMLC